MPNNPQKDMTLSVKEAAAAIGRSPTTVKNLLATGKLPNALRVPDPQKPHVRRWEIPVDDLRTAGYTVYSTSTSTPKTGLSKDYARNILDTVKAICAYALIQGYHFMDPSDGIKPRKPKPGRERRAPNTSKPRMFTLEECQRIARHLSPRNALTFWIQRTLGLRVGEVYGIRIRDITDYGHVGLLLVKRQGGTRRPTRDANGEIITKDEIDLLKSEAAYRPIGIPAPLMALIRMYIDSEHRNPATGAVNERRRLIRAARHAEKGGLGAYWRQLAIAYARENLDFAHLGFHSATHQLRKSLLTELEKRLSVTGSLLARIAGHKVKGVEYDPSLDVLYRHYIIEDPDIKPVIDVAIRHGDYIEAEIGSLFNEPSHRPAVTGKVPVSEAASILGVGRTAIDRLIANDLLSVEWEYPDTGCPYRLVDVDELEILREKLSSVYTRQQAAVDLGVSEMTVYQWIQKGDLIARMHPDFALLDLDRASVAQMKVILDRDRELNQRSVTIPVAARMLDRSPEFVRYHLGTGELEYDPDVDRRGCRYVTRASIDRAQATLRPVRRRAPAYNVDGWIPVSDLRRTRGLSLPDIKDLVARGRLHRRDFHQRSYISEASINAYFQHGGTAACLTDTDTARDELLHGTTGDPGASTIAPLVLKPQPDGSE